VASFYGRRVAAHADDLGRALLNRRMPDDQVGTREREMAQ